MQLTSANALIAELMESPQVDCAIASDLSLFSYCPKGITL
tara:strand:+ start:239 stop:358 length:120 start_codon:yes stop_codon:yes gene_type:complete